HYIAQRGEAAVVHVRRGARHVAQARDAELAVVALLQVDVPRAGRARARGVVVEAAEEVIRARLQLLDAPVAARIDLLVLQEKRNSRIGELAVGERRSEVADAAVALADEGAQPALRGERVALHRGRVVLRQRVAELVERRTPADE